MKNLSNRSCPNMLIIRHVYSLGALISCLMMLCSNGVILAQYPPRVNELGSTAIHKDSSIMVSWANKCIVNRGWTDISSTNREKVSYGTTEMALSKADGSVVSLGDSGVAILQFPFPIRNGEGPDFAVYENAFDDYFLELAHVKVSSDGINYFEFPSISLTDTTVEIGTFDSLNTRKINHLAGKYRVFYGTPFDLNDLQASNLLDVNKITHVMIVDVVGSVNSSWGTRDSEGHLINDPFPTPFPNGGFDLDAIGVIHQADRSSVQHLSDTDFSVFPNPVMLNEGIMINAASALLNEIERIQIVNLLGRGVPVKWHRGNGQIIVKADPQMGGIYFIQLVTKTQIFSLRIKIIGN